MDAFEKEFRRRCGFVPEYFSFPVESFLLKRIVDVQRMLGPAVDEHEGQVPTDVELALKDAANSRHEPLFIVAVFWY